MFINRSGAMVLPFLSIYLNQELGFTLTQAGIMMTFYGLGSVFGALTGGHLTDKLGFTKVMLFSLFFTSIAFLVVMNLKTFNLLCLGIFSLSFIADIFRPANLTAIQAFSTKENLTRSLGVVRLAINLGYAFGPFLGGLIIASFGYDFVFIANATSVGFAGIAFFLFFRNKNKKPPPKLKSQNTEILKMPWKDTAYLTYLLSFCVIVIVFFQFVYIIPLYYKTELGFNEAFVGLLMGLNGLIIFILELPLIYKIEKKYRPVSLVVAGGILIALSSISLVLIPVAIVAAIVYVVFSTLGEILSFPFSNTFALSFTNDRNRGRYMGFYTMTFSIAHVIAPLGWFFIADNFGYAVLWLTGFIAALLASFIIFRSKKKQGVVEVK